MNRNFKKIVLSLVFMIFLTASVSAELPQIQYSENENIVFVVSDDGAGIPKNQMNLLLNGEGKSTHGSNIGIYNTHRRLQLYYGDQIFGLTYRSTLEIGTEVEIRIPIVEYKNQETI